MDTTRLRAKQNNGCIVNHKRYTVSQWPSIIQSKQIGYLLQEAHTERKYVQVEREPPPVKKTHRTGHSETLHYYCTMKYFNAEVSTRKALCPRLVQRWGRISTPSSRSSTSTLIRNSMCKMSCCYRDNISHHILHNKDQAEDRTLAWADITSHSVCSLHNEPLNECTERQRLVHNKHYRSSLGSARFLCKDALSKSHSKDIYNDFYFKWMLFFWTFWKKNLIK